MLGHTWEPAEGTCIDVRIKGNDTSDGPDNHRFLMEVRPRNGEPFRVELKVPGFHENFKGPSRGQVCQLECDVKRQDAKWDFSDPGLSWKTSRKAGAAQFEAELQAKPWAAQPGDKPQADEPQADEPGEWPTTDDPAARLSSLKALYDNGALTSAEAQRQRIIAAI